MERRFNRTTAPRASAMTFTFALVAAVLLHATPAFAQHRLANRLPAPVRGPAAVSALGAHLPEVAHAYGLDPARLQTLFQSQPSLGVDRDGVLVFTCAAPAALAAEGASVGSASTTSGSSTVLSSSAVGTDPLHLHSLAGAPLVIFLDFTGHTTSGTQWNTSFATPTIVSQPFDLDGDPTTFNATELALIQHVWQRVAEDYAGFAVDVTTEDPGVEALQKTSASDANYGIRVVISPTNWYNSSAGGVSYVGAFDWNSDTPSFVFTQQLANGEKYIAEAAAHEIGHTLGLYHDGVGGSAPSEYFMGQGDWAPIMGASYYKPITQFSRGEYAYANNTQDDLATIASFIPYANDDHGNTLATASALNGPNVSDGGTIERNTDVDVFRFTTGSGPISLTLQGTSPEPDLDIKAELLDGNGQVLLTSDPSGLSVSFATTLAAGTYYLRVSGTGAGDPSSTGYSNYASLGNYIITGTLTATTTTSSPQPPVAVITASTTAGPAPLTVSFSGAGSSDADGSIVSYRWDFGTGATGMGATVTYTYNTPGTYAAALTVTDNTGLTNTAKVNITVAAAVSTSAIAPAITAQPVSQNVAVGGTATFSLAATGSPTPTVTWYRNGVTFAGWMTPTLAISGVTANDVGTYTAIVANSAGSITSAPATLTIATTTSNVAPVITTQPGSQNVTAGTNVTFSVMASGSPAPTYQWYKNGTVIPGATGTKLALPTVSATDAATYYAVASNIAGAATSATATLTVSTSGATAPTITSQPVSQSIATGGTAIFSVGVSGTPTPTITWYRDGVTFAGWTTATLTVTGATSNDIGTYTAVVANSAGTVTSAAATLSVH